MKTKKNYCQPMAYEEGFVANKYCIACNEYEIKHTSTTLAGDSWAARDGLGGAINKRCDNGEIDAAKHIDPKSNPPITLTAEQLAYVQANNMCWYWPFSKGTPSDYDTFRREALEGYMVYYNSKQEYVQTPTQGNGSMIIGVNVWTEVVKPTRS